jgi:hypothetical protein
VKSAKREKREKREEKYECILVLGIIESFAVTLFLTDNNATSDTIASGMLDELATY